jgi:hypothetical protein
MADLDWIALNSEPQGDCLIWTGPVNDSGYGKINDRRVHRIVAEAHYGPSEMCVLHSCDTPRCVRPEHLRYGTRAENAADAFERGRHRCGEAHRFTKLTAEEVLAIFADARPTRVLAEEYGASRQTIADIRYGRTWRHLTAP